MTSEPNPPENLVSTEEAALVAPPSPPSSEEALWYELDDEESVLAKHTLLKDSEAESEPPQIPKSQTKAKYVQGILQEEQVYIITNLLRDKSQTLRQPQRVWTIGRNRLAALPLRDRKMSRRHAVILYAAGKGFYLVDLNSMNGSYVNGIRVQQRQLLKDGDRVCLGDTEFSFYVSCQQRVLDPIHSEVLMRLNNQESRPTPFVDYLEEGMEIEFKLVRE